MLQRGCLLAEGPLVQKSPPGARHENCATVLRHSGSRQCGRAVRQIRRGSGLWLAVDLQASPAVMPTNLLYNVVATRGALYRHWRQGQARRADAGSVPGTRPCGGTVFMWRPPRSLRACRGFGYRVMIRPMSSRVRSAAAIFSMSWGLGGFIGLMGLMMR